MKDIEPDHFNPYANLLYQQDAKAVIPPQSAKLFLQLSTQQKIPAWAIAAVDVKSIRAAAT